jgi:hypothetical protein
VQSPAHPRKVVLEPSPTDVEHRPLEVGEGAGCVSPGTPWQKLKELSDPCRRRPRRRRCPRLSTVTVKSKQCGGRNVASPLRQPFMVTVQLSVPVQPPDHPSNTVGGPKRGWNVT